MLCGQRAFHSRFKLQNRFTSCDYVMVFQKYAEEGDQHKGTQHDESRTNPCNVALNVALCKLYLRLGWPAAEWESGPG